MEGRKLQLSGGSTYMVSLPKWWVTRAGLVPGDTLFVTSLPDGGISVRTGPGRPREPRRRVLQVGAEESPDHLFRWLLGAYVAGHSVVEVQFKPEAGAFVRGVVREFCRRAMGPEIIDETASSLTIQDLSGRSDLSPEKCLRRMHLVVRAMVQDAVLALRTNPPALAAEVLQRGTEVERLYWMIAKQSLQATALPGGISGDDSPGASHGHQLVAKLLERVADHAQRIARAVPKTARMRFRDGSFGRDLDGVGASALGLLDGSFRALMTGDLDLANGTLDDYARLQVRLNGLARHLPGQNNEQLLALSTVIESLGRTAGYSADIAEQAINFAILSDTQFDPPAESPAPLSPDRRSGPIPRLERASAPPGPRSAPARPTYLGRGTPPGVPYPAAPARSAARSEPPVPRSGSPLDTLRSADGP